ncbi:DUF7557 family protein [Haladaptatus cibarius]|uniref:DUF7557 family protein n=1 Tax=Haladaptatus cibarius TaxID=453847 RepID=UPI000A00FB54
MANRSETTTISITDETWTRLDARKNRGESFNDVVSDLLDLADTVAPADPKTTPPSNE